MANANRHSKQTDLLRRYLSGEIDARGEAELFRAAGEDEALAEALAGYQQQPEANHQGSLNKLRAKFPRAERKSLVPMKAISIAASLLLLLFVGYYGYQNRPSVNKAGQASSDYTRAAEAAPLADSEAPAIDEKLIAPEAPSGKISGQTAPAVANNQTLPKDARAKKREASKTARASQTETAPKPQAIPPNAGRGVSAAPTAATPSPASPPPPTVLVTPEPELAEEEAFSLDEMTAITDAFADSARGGKEEKKVGPATGSRPPGMRVISGFVTDENDRPITNANITLPGQPIGESTDSSGYFEFVADQTVRQLRIGHPDFENSDIQLPRNENELVINLSKPADFNANEVEDDWLMTGARTTIYPNAEKTSATVKGGMRGLRQDIQAAKPADLPAGIVKASFSVQADGSLTDFDFGRKSEEELIDFVRNYLQQNSEWALRGGDTPTRMAITFRFR